MDSLPIIRWIFFSVVALRKGRSFVGFFSSLLLSPILGIVATLIVVPNGAEVDGNWFTRGRIKKWGVVAIALVAAAGCSRQELRGSTPGRPSTVVEALPAGVATGDAQAPGQSGGIWKVSGSDVTGSYTGRVELRAVGQAFRFTRVIDYTNVKVEGGRSFSWVWEGTARTGAAGDFNISVKLQRADFVKSRGSFVRAAADSQPLEVVGHFVVSGTTLVGSFTAPGIQAQETWFDVIPLLQKPIFAKDIVELPLDAPLTDPIKAGLFQQFASYHALPEIRPYTNNPAFKKAVHSIIVDKTDFDFYQANPNALRVVDKVLDPISRQETLARANAYRWTLARKAAFYDDDVAIYFIDPTTGMLGLERVGTQLVPSHDSALWTGTYVASQAYRHKLTGSTDALNNVIKSVQGLLTLVEITGNPKTFARTLRPATGNPTGTWHAGTGAFANLEWEEGGNNDMFKGVIYGILSAYNVLCDRVSGHQNLCDRIRKDARHIANDLDIARPSGQNRLAAQWLAAYVTGKIGFFIRATAEWAIQAPVLAQGNVTTVYSNGIADWSGTHLSFVEYVVFNTLGQRYPLPGVRAKSAVASGVDAIYAHFTKVRMGLWSVAFASLGAAPRPAAADDARWRLREFPTPKPQFDVDHRINPAFVMSPYPSQPWKNDWTRNDRTQSLRGYPLFEGMACRVYAWSANTFEYRVNSTGTSFPGADYLHAYWLGRQLGVFAANE